ncbi:MAG TPA: hypothetical protein VJI70_01655 [Candidatus Paceibacterota bacterium]
MDTPKKYIRTFAGDMEALRTYSGDFSDRVKETDASTVSILATEQDAAPRVYQDVPEKPSRANTLYIIAGFALLIIGIVGAYIAYTRYLIKMQPIIGAPVIFSPIFVDGREIILGTTPDAILKEIGQSVTRELAINTVRLLYVDSAATTNNSIFSALLLNAPGALIRNVNGDNSMVGIVNTGPSSTKGDSQKSPFFILSVASYSDTFAGMLAWEPKMPQNLEVLFPPHPSQSISGVSSTTTPKIITVIAQTPVTGTPVSAFRDEVVNNHDVRIYRDDKGRSVLLYGYWNQTTLVITRDPAAFTEILDRLATARAQ